MSIIDSHEPPPGSSPRLTERVVEERARVVEAHEHAVEARARVAGKPAKGVDARALDGARVRPTRPAEGPSESPAPKTPRPVVRASRAGDVALEDEVWMARAQALVRLVVDAVDVVEGAVLVRDHRFLGETASRERPERGVLRGRAGRDATLYLTRAPREPARLAAIREAGVRRLVVCEATATSITREAERLGLALDVLDGAGMRCA